MKILANDGISKEGIDLLTQNGFEVVTAKVEQDQLAEAINKEGYVALLVRSATTVRKDLIDACPNMKLIGRGGVGMDNIDVEYARSIGREVINTPGASSQSVAELVMTHMFSISRFMNDSYKQMPANGVAEFNTLKKKYGKGVELRGKTLGIVGFGRIGQALASYALGCGMKVIAVDMFTNPVQIEIPIEGMTNPTVTVTPVSDLNSVIGELDYLSLHVPKQADGSAVITSTEIAKMKDGARIINAARGGVIDEDDLIKALDSGKISYAALDVFENEPNPRADLLQHDKIASSPHIGAATNEAQGRIGTELAEKIIAYFK
ncbi:MAG: D-2-hydroxyacid dehydrogenase [Crocinitomicaceae bacterium]